MCNACSYYYCYYHHYHCNIYNYIYIIYIYTYIAGLALQRCRKILRDLGIFQAAALFFCLAHAPSVCTKTSAARQWQIWSAKWCWFQLPTQWQDGYQIDALMTCTPWAHLFLQKAGGSRCFAIWTAELPGWVTPSSVQQVSMPLETLLLQI